MKTASDEQREAGGADGFPWLGDRLIGGSAPPDERQVRNWLGPEAFEHWAAMRRWIDATYPQVFEPDWLYGGKKRGWSLRYTKTKALCTLVPAYRMFSVLIVLGRAERKRFEERRASWSPELAKLYDDTKTFHDGKCMTVPVPSAEHLREVVEVVRMKRPVAASR